MELEIAEVTMMIAVPRILRGKEARVIMVRSSVRSNERTSSVGTLVNMIIPLVSNDSRCGR